MMDLKILLLLNGKHVLFSFTHDQKILQVQASVKLLAYLCQHNASVSLLSSRHL